MKKSEALKGAVQRVKQRLLVAGPAEEDPNRGVSAWQQWTDWDNGHVDGHWEGQVVAKAGDESPQE